MSTKVLGQTGVMLPELAFGTWQYNGTADTLRRTVEMGGIFLDTAERYRNESLVGTAIKGIRDRVFIATKVLAFSPLGRGPQSVLNSDSRSALDRISKETGKTKVQIALNWCSLQGTSHPITTASSIEHVEENWGAVGWRLSPEHVRLLNESISFQRRSSMEQAARRLARRVLRLVGR